MFLLTLNDINKNVDKLRGPGVYRIFSSSGKSYIGSASSSRGLAGRLKDHERMLKAGVHHAFKLQLAWNKYGELFVEVLELVSNNLIEREQHYINKFKAAQEGYNSNPIAGKTRKGVKLSEETKEKIRKSNTGKTASEETRERMRVSANRKMQEDPEFGKRRSKKLIGVPRSDEFKRKISIKQRERFKDPEERKRVGPKKGYKHTKEELAKMHQPKSEEHKKKLSEARKLDYSNGKICRSCSQLKPVTDFYLSKGRPLSYCKICSNKKSITRQKKVS